MSAPAAVFSKNAFFLNPHPAVWIAAWSVAAMLLQKLPLPWLGALAAPIFFLIVRFAAQESLSLLRRSRWLLLGIVVMFVLGTPGERVPGLMGSAGMTFDGLTLAGEHVLRLVLLLTTLAWLLAQLRQEGLIAGLHRLLWPLGRWRDRLIVRLLLTLEQVNLAAPAPDWRTWLAGEGGQDQGEADCLSLHVPHLRPMDRFALLGSGIALVLVVAG